MSKIKSLADELKAKLDLQQVPLTRDFKLKHDGSGKANHDDVLDPMIVASFMENINAFSMDGQEKILIRLDRRSMNLLRRLKLASNIDMTKLIVYAFSDFLSRHSWLSEYISQTLNQSEP
jgi:hypothetical protein